MEAAVRELAGPSPAALDFELAERKGLGHPDTVCDSLAEAFSVALSRHYVERFGAILHHNVDKALLWGGAARPAFGGGEVLAPIEVYLSGRATHEFRGVTIPVADIAVESSRAWLAAHLPRLDAVKHVRIHPLVRPTSPDLAELFFRGFGRTALANDTSFGVGFAPLDALERAVLAAERRLNEPAVKAAHPAIGEDVKVMGLRRGAAIELTVACAFVGRHVPDMKAYRDVRARARTLALEAAREASGAQLDAAINTADGDTEDSIYLTVTGSSAEAGDDGQVGRGNRANGLITPGRPMSLEALAGKNPVSHVGKIYNIAARRIAEGVVAQVEGVVEAHCLLLSRIGHPIDQPELFEMRVRSGEAGTLENLAPRVVDVARDGLAGAGRLWREALAGGLAVC